MKTLQADVCVVGSGIAGICAALAAREAGAEVVLLTQGPACSGSSFSGTTWGLGMVGPATDAPADVEAFVAAVLAPAGGVGSSRLVRALAEGYHPDLAWFCSRGAVVEGVKPGHEGDRAYVPCFDTAVRGWHGFHAQASAGPLRRSLATARIPVVEHCEVLSLLRPPAPGPLGAPAVCGAVAFPRRAGAHGSEPVCVRAAATVLACGGLAALHSPTLAAPTATGDALSLAEDAGARLGNLAFEQLMVAVETARGPAVFNEKLWRHTRLLKGGRDVFELAGIDPAAAAGALEAHSWHGPYSAQRPSRLVEEAIWAVGGTCEAVVGEPAEAQPFIDTYMAWLDETCGLGYGDPMPVAVYHQASNGGIRIEADGATGVTGLFAAGECAPIFARDRLGGIASSTAVVFGRAAGRAAAAWAGRCGTPGRAAPDPVLASPSGHPRTLAEIARMDRGAAARLGDDLRAYLRRHAAALVAETVG